MTEFEFDVVVIGAGHAGCEAASAAARLGCNTCLVTMDMNKIAQMSCNPAIGGIAKGQIVREIDALGGQMGIVTDNTAIQFRMLNRSKGPAVWRPRSQCDRMKFSLEWRRILENTPNLSMWQDQADELLVEDGEVRGVHTIWDVTLRAKAVIITAGTFLNGLLHVGRRKVPGGRCAEPPALHLTESIARHGIRYDRKPEHPSGSTHARWTFQCCPNRRAKTTSTAFHMSQAKGRCRNCTAGCAQPTPKYTKYCGADCPTHRCTTDKYKASDQDTARALKQNS